MKIKELRLLNITIKQGEDVIYKGTTEEMPNELKEKEYKKIYFEGVDVTIEIWKEMFMNWTEEQKQAIFEKGSNILVAAAARKSEKRQY